MRFIVMPKTLDNTHPLWPNEEVFYLFDLDKCLLSMSCYTTYERAESIAKRKNST